MRSSGAGTVTPLSWDPTPGAHIYVDESTAGDYLLMGAAIASADAPQMRSVMRGLLLPGSRSLHMRKEQKRAATILSTVVGLGPKVAIFRVSRTTPALDARRATVHALAELACQLRADRVVFDTIDSMSARDRAWVIEGVHLAGEPTPPFGYHHQRRHEEPLLWIPDAVGWAWARGGQHRRAVERICYLVDL